MAAGFGLEADFHQVLVAKRCSLDQPVAEGPIPELSQQSDVVITADDGQARGFLESRYASISAAVRCVTGDAPNVRGDSCLALGTRRLARAGTCGLSGPRDARPRLGSDRRSICPRASKREHRRRLGGVCGGRRRVAETERARFDLFANRPEFVFRCPPSLNMASQVAVETESVVTSIYLDAGVPGVRAFAPAGCGATADFPKIPIPPVAPCHRRVTSRGTLASHRAAIHPVRVGGFGRSDSAADPTRYFTEASPVNAPSLALLAKRLSPYEIKWLVPSLNSAAMKLLFSDDRLTYAVAPCPATTAHWLFVNMQSSMWISAVGPYAATKAEALPFAVLRRIETVLDPAASTAVCV